MDQQPLVPASTMDTLADGVNVTNNNHNNSDDGNGGNGGRSKWRWMVLIVTCALLGWSGLEMSHILRRRPPVIRAITIDTTTTGTDAGGTGRSDGMMEWTASTATRVTKSGIIGTSWQKKPQDPTKWRVLPPSPTEGQRWYPSGGEWNQFVDVQTLTDATNTLIKEGIYERERLKRSRMSNATSLEHLRWCIEEGAIRGKYFGVL
jgi:hypothetical protein